MVVENTIRDIFVVLNGLHQGFSLVSDKRWPLRLRSFLRLG